MNLKGSSTKSEEQLLDERHLLTSYAEDAILNHASVLACECPKHLLFLLGKVRSFRDYEQGCLTASQRDHEIHEWLLEQALEFDRMISATIVELARREGMVDRDGRINQQAKG